MTQPWRRTACIVCFSQPERCAECVAAQRDSLGHLCDNGGAGTKAAPEVRQHPEGLTAGTSPVDLSEGGKPMASPNDTPGRP